MPFCGHGLPITMRIKLRPLITRNRSNCTNRSMCVFCSEIISGKQADVSIDAHNYALKANYSAIERELS